MNSRPVAKMPSVDPMVGPLLNRVLPAFQNRIDDLGMINQDIHGNVILQVPAIGSKSTDSFTVDRVTVRVDGSDRIDGSIELPIRTLAITCIAQAADFTILTDATLGAFSVYLPAANLVGGRIYAIKKIDSSANVVTVIGNGIDTIDGRNMYALSVQWNGVVVQSNGLGWFILSSI